MSKNIWIFNHYVQPPSLGKEQRHSNFANHLIKKGYKVSVFYSSQIHNQPINMISDNKKFKVTTENSIKYIAIKTRPYENSGKQRVLNMLDFYLGLNKVIKKNINEFGKPDVIYASSVHPLTLVAGIRIAKKLNVPCVCEVRDLWPLTLVKMDRIREGQFITRLLYFLEKWIYKKADRLIFTMQGGPNYITDQGWEGKVDINKIHNINNGVDLEKFERNAQLYKVENILDEDSFIVNYTGALGQANMVGTIIEAAEIIQKQTSKKVMFEIYGDGPKRKKYEEYLKEKEINNVNFRGRVESKYIPNILSKGNVNVITGKNSELYKYGFSQNKFFTYLASGRPMISNREVHNLLEKTGSGKIVKPESPSALAEGILEFYDMKEQEYSNYCINAAKLAGDYDYGKLTDKLIKVLFD